MTYEERIERLRRTKEAQTAQKLRDNKDYMNEDDYGSVPAPKDVTIEIEYNDPVHKTFYGAKAWAANFRRLLEKHPVYIDPDDALAGRWMYILQRLRPFESAVSKNNMEMAPIFDYDFLKPTQEKYGIIPGIGKMHHFAPDYAIGLALGWGGLQKKLDECRKQHPESAWLYDAEDEVMAGIRSWTRRTVERLKEMETAERDPERKENLHEMREVNENILDKAPQTFHEACQWIAWFNMLNRSYNRAGSGCQIDELLRPYYEKDLTQGRIDKEKAIFILCCLLLNDPTYYQVGGPAADGHDVTSEVSFMVLEAAHRMKTSANLTIPVHSRLDPKLLHRAVEILVDDRKANPRFSGCDNLVRGFMKNGYPIELARLRRATGCHWMSLPGLEYTLNDLIKINFACVMNAALDEYMEKDSPQRSTEALYELFLKHLEKAVHCVAEGIDFHFRYQYLNAPELMLNLLCHGPLEKGLDASQGGMEYYNICVDGAALATTADSFAAIEQRLDREKRFGWDTLYKTLKDNYSGREGAYIRSMMRASERFGAGASLGDRWAQRISRDFTRIVSEKHTPDGYLMIPGLFTWANTINMGRDTLATANGRLSGEPISHGANPDPGFRKDGALTALSNAVASVQPGRGNTAPLQLELDPSLASRDELVSIVEALIKSHFEKGGTLININVMDKDVLLDAYAHPEKHQDLIVRVTGFTAYFSVLGPDFRKMVIDRVIQAE